MKWFGQCCRELRPIMLLLPIVLLASALLANAGLDYATIHSTGFISLAEVTAKSGSAADIQAAVNSMIAAGGGTVRIPSGTYQWNGETVNSVGGVMIIGAGSTNTILHNNKAAPFNTMFVVDGTNGKPCRISGIRFEGNVASSNDDVSGTAVDLEKCMDFRVDHCTFIDFPNKAIGVSNVWTGTTRGVIDHNLIDNPYKDVFGSPPTAWGYGIIVVGQARTWHSNIADFLGKYETAPSGFPIVYIEDNTFSRCRHAIASNQGAWYVVRHCSIEEPRPEHFGLIDVHGLAGVGAPGGRGLECYNNTIKGCEYSYDGSGRWLSIGHQIRGGGGVIFDNDFIDLYVGILLQKETAEYWKVDDLYFWDNAIIRDKMPTDQMQLLFRNDGSYLEGQDFYQYEMPSYTPYPYPHPLTLAAAP